MANTKSIDLELSSSQYLSAADSASLDIISDLSIMCWLNFETDTGSPIICSKYETATANRSWSLVYSATNDEFILIYSDDGTNITLHDSDNSLGITTGVWYHFALSFDASAHATTFYLNGVAKGTDTAGSMTSIHSGSAAVLIGAEKPSAPRQYFDGKIDEFGLYNTALSGATILADYNSGAGTERSSGETGLAAGYRFEDALTDLTGNNDLSAPNGSAYSTDVPFPTTDIKSINGLAYASVKSKNGLAIGSIKSINNLE